MSDLAVTPHYSGFWRRFLSALIDGIIVAVIAGIISAILGAVGAGGTAARGGEGLIIGLIYYIWGWGTGQTVGCMALKIRLVDQQTGGAPGYMKAVIRYIVSVVCGITVILGIISGLWLIWDSKKQTWWDKVAGTLVVDV
jgi:uncharacterized RDD family membrane protein YckC